MKTAKEAGLIWLVALSEKNVKAMKKSHQEKMLLEKEATQVETVECADAETLEVTSVEAIEVISVETIAVVAEVTSKKEVEVTFKKEAEVIAGVNHLTSRSQRKNKMTTIRRIPIADTMSEDHSNVEIYL